MQYDPFRRSRKPVNHSRSRLQLGVCCMVKLKAGLCCVIYHNLLCMVNLSMVDAAATTNMNNSTINPDVIVNNCFGSFDTVACIRSAILTFLGVLTAVLCVIRVIRLHQANHQNWHQYFIFYCASVECVLGSVHWVMSTYIQIDFVLQWLKMLQFLVMCHFYWTLATRALRREIWTKRFVVPFLTIAGAYFTIVCILGIINMQSTFVECLEPYWLMMSSAEFVIVQLFCVAGFYITRRLNEISTLDSVRRAQKRDLWCIVVVFEISAFVGVVYDLSLKLVGDSMTGCSAIFNHAQDFFSAIFLSFMISKLLLPIWVMLFVFQPVPQVVVEPDDLIPALGDDGNSAFSASTDEQYRQLYQPVEDYRTLSFDAPSINSSPGSVGVTPTTPNGTANVYGNKVNQNLGTIQEENHSRQTSPDPRASSSVNNSLSSSKPKQSIHSRNGVKSSAKSQTSDKNTGAGGRRNMKEEAGIVGNSRDVADGRNVSRNERATNSGDVHPRFYINDNDDQDTASPPRAKFQV